MKLSKIMVNNNKNKGTRNERTSLSRMYNIPIQQDPIDRFRINAESEIL